jgi:hypothetical protein
MRDGGSPDASTIVVGAAVNPGFAAASRGCGRDVGVTSHETSAVDVGGEVGEVVEDLGVGRGAEGAG